VAHYRSPYSVPGAVGYRRAPRWPWAFAVVILLALVGVGAVLLNGNLLDEQQSPVDELSQRAASGDGEGEPTNPLSLTNPTREAAPTPTLPPPTETPAPTPTPVDTDAPVQLVQAWVAHWSTGNYGGMYDLVSTDIQKKLPREDFIRRYEEIETEAGLEQVTGEVTGEPDLDGAIPVTFVMQSKLVGEIKQDQTVPIVKDGENWRVQWTPSLIFTDLGDSGCVAFEGTRPTRGRILDRNGKVLAQDIVVARVGVIPGELTDEDAAVATLSDLLKMPAEDIRARYADAQPEWFQPIKDMPEDSSTDIINAINTANGGEGIPGVQVRRATSRTYPYGAVAAHITGYVSVATQEDVENDETGTVKADAMVGRAGLEYGANELLTGKPGGTLNIVECQTRATRTVIAESEAVPSKDLILTVDIEFQKQVDKSLTDVKGSERGSAVVIDPRDGAVLAMVSHPSFDPNGFINGFSPEDQKKIDDENHAPLRNRAAGAAYPTGSIAKLITASAAMHYLDYTADTEIDCPKSVSLGDQTWNDWVVEYGSGAQGMLTLHEGLVRSCNTVFYQIGIDLDDENPDYLPQMAKAYGLGAPTQIPYFPEIGGTVPSDDWKQEEIGDGWATGDAVNLAIGQGFMLATPLQMANAYATIANGGTVWRPFIVDATREPGSEATTKISEKKELGKLPLTEEQVAELHTALRDQTSNDEEVGSARVFGGFNWPIAGKTGTAQVDEQRSSKPHSWFAAYGPGDEGDTATIASVVMVEKAGEGVAHAAPATKRIYSAYLRTDLRDREIEE
jgi:penicillin-binding protein 2